VRDQRVHPSAAPEPAGWPRPLGFVSGTATGLAVTIWMVSGRVINPIVDRSSRGYSEDIGWSDVSARVWLGLGLQLAVLAIGLCAMARRSTRAFGQALAFSAGVCAVVLFCVFGVLVSASVLFF
jgi:hypothetical protein